MANEKAKALSNEELDNASGGFIRYKGGIYEVVENAGNVINGLSSKNKNDAIEMAKTSNCNTVFISEDQLSELKKKKNVQLGDTIYYSDGFIASTKK